MNSKVKIILNKELDKMIVANTGNGVSIRLPIELYDIVIEMLNGIEDISKFFIGYENEDKVYLKNIYDLFINNNFINEIDNKTKIVSLQITNKCNLRCLHCCVSSGEEMKDELNLKEIKEAIDKIIIFNPEAINISGGEPLVNKNFYDISKYIYSNYKGRRILSTNATLIDENNVKYISKYYNQVDISLDGIDENTCSQIRGKGVFKKVISAVKLLQENDFYNINLSMVLTEYNEKYSSKFIELNKKLNTNYITRLFSPVGRGKKNVNLFMKDYENYTYIPADFQISKIEDEDCGVSSCSAGEKELFILSNGDVYPCPSFYYDEFKIFNIKEVDNIKNNINFRISRKYVLSVINNIDDKQYNKCKVCNLYYFCWTCPGHINEFIGRRNALNYRCNMMKKILNRRVWIE